MEIKALFRQLVELGASDIFFVVGRPICYKVGSALHNLGEKILLPQDTRDLLEGIYVLANQRPLERLLDKGDDDFSFAIAGLSRFRASAYKQRGSLAAVIRVVSFELPKPEAFHIPEGVMGLADIRQGLVLVTGPSGSGKSTTLACIIDRINDSRSSHIITLEDPVEFIHAHKRSIVSQREIELDSENYVVALRAALRQSPDVILIGELRDAESITIAMTAAETGHLVISTLHTVGAANTVDRIVDVYPAQRQAQVRMQLSMVLKAVVSQQLVPCVTEGEVLPAFEILHCTTAVRNMIRESKTHQIDSVIASSGTEGMVGMDAALLERYRTGKISAETALSYSLSPEALKRKLGV